LLKKEATGLITIGWLSIIGVGIAVSFGNEPLGGWTMAAIIVGIVAIGLGVLMAICGKNESRN